MLCPICDQEGVRYGRNRNGTQRWYCRPCMYTFSEEREQPPRVFSDRQLTMDKASKALALMMEGTSIRGICRLLRLGKHSLLSFLLRIGQGCERLLDQHILGVPVESVQCDELWSYVHCKEKTRLRLHPHMEEIGDCYTWTAIDRDSKLVLAHVVGKRDNAAGMELARKLRRATCGHFQIDTDGLGVYASVIPMVFGRGQDHAMVVKIFGAPADEEARRYSPAKIIDVEKYAASGWPNLREASTSYVERSNLTIRMMLRRFTRLTNAFSKSWDHHEAALALLFAWYNFVRPHMTLNKRAGRKCTPAMAAGLTDHPWSAKELIERGIPRGSQAIAS